MEKFKLRSFLPTLKFPSDLGRYVRASKMSNMKGPTEGGSGGKRGHSNMEHWVTTEEIKESTRRLRRNNEKSEIQKELKNPGQRAIVSNIRSC